MLKRIIMIIMGACAVLNSAALAEVRVEGCIQAALKFNPLIRAADSEAGAMLESSRQASASRLPNLDFTGTYRHQSMTPEIFIDPIPLSPQGPVIQPFGNGLRLGALDNTDFRVTVTQPLFSGFRLCHAAKGASSAAVAAKMAAEQVRQNLVFQVRTAYGNLLKAKSAVIIAGKSQEQIGEHLRDVRAFFIQGLCRRDELLGAEVKWEESELCILQAGNAVRLACSALENLTGMSLEDSVLAHPETDESVPGDLESSIQKAFTLRPELAALEWSRQAAEHVKKTAWGAFLPSVAVFGSLGYGRPGLDLIHDRWMDYWIAGAGVEWKLWDWGKRKSAVREARHRINGLEERQEQARDAVVLDVKQAYFRCGEARRRLRLTAWMHEKAMETFRIVENSYRQGQASHTEYFDAHSDLIRSQLLRSQAEIDVFLEKSNWDRALGDQTMYMQQGMP